MPRHDRNSVAHNDGSHKDGYHNDVCRNGVCRNDVCPECRDRANDMPQALPVAAPGTAVTRAAFTGGDRGGGQWIC